MQENNVNQMKKVFWYLALLCIPIILSGQENSVPSYKLSGFVKNDLFWDSRQTVDIREGHFLLFPKPVLEDVSGADINAHPSFNFLAIQSRLKLDLNGPDALGAKTSGMMEAEFFGMSEADINGLRLRHAIIKLNWPETELMMGQFWHPMFNTSCFPDVVSFNTGVPFLVFSRNPQVRLTQDLGKLKIYMTLLSQLDFKSTGPLLGASTSYIRNSGIPSLNINAEYSVKNADRKTGFLIGFAGNFKKLTPRLQVSGVKVNDSFHSFSYMAYLKAESPLLTVKGAAYYGQNTYDYTMLGGYVEFPDPSISNRFNYENVSVLSSWAELMTNGKKVKAGLFLGYSKNLGTDQILPQGTTFYSRGDNIDQLYRISPRMIWNFGKFRIAPEVEYTVAYYGETKDQYGRVTNASPVGNIRLLTGLFYFF